LSLDNFLVYDKKSLKQKVERKEWDAEEKNVRIFVHAKTKQSIQNLSIPWLSDCVEAGYLVIPKKLSVYVGQATITRLLWIRLFPEWGSRIRLGFPLLVFDYIHGEYIAGTIKMMGYDVAWHELVDRDVVDARNILTSEMIESGDTEFLELVPLVGIEPLCSLKYAGHGHILRGDVNFAPHIRAPAFLPSQRIVNIIYGLPTNGPRYGALMFGDEVLVDPQSGKCIAYRVRQEILFEHELVTGTTGKGKTAKCKNDIYMFVKEIGGAVVIIDTHNEYSMIYEDPIREDDPIKPNEFDIKIWNDLNIKPSKIEDLIVWIPLNRGLNVDKIDDKISSKKNIVRFFSIQFRNISPSMLQYYLPALSPQGYYVLPKLVSKFRKIYKDDNNTLEKFYRWLENTRFSKDFISDATRDALLRRIASILEEKIFDREDGRELDIKTLLHSRRVSIIRTDLIPSATARRIIVMHVISEIARQKLRDYDERYPPTMLLIDEAHNYFPRFVYDLNEKDWVLRTVSWVERIAREGRKFRLRIEFSTQSPEDLNPRILKTVNTYTLFGLTPLQIRTLKKFMELPVDKTVLMNLPTRCAVIYSRSNAGIPMKIFVPWALLRHKITKKS